VVQLLDSDIKTREVLDWNRRIDQALYDLIANAKRDILIVTFAAAKFRGEKFGGQRNNK
jgi:hypothetical protein